MTQFCNNAVWLTTYQCAKYSLSAAVAKTLSQVKLFDNVVGTYNKSW